MRDRLGAATPFGPVRSIVATLLLLFALAPIDARAHTLKTIHSFCAQSGCADGQEPSAGLVADAAGDLFGTTLFGGDAGVGTVFELIANAHRTKWRYKRLYSFCAQSGCADGSDAEAALIIDAQGSLYGVTMAGGANDGGVAYRLAPNAKRTRWTYSVLYSFCALGDCADGREPQAALSYLGKESGAPYDGTSPLYGTASQAGANKQGVAFTLSPGAPWSEQVIHAFCSESACADGADPVAPLTLDASGHVFGTTYMGGAGNTGTVFEIASGTLTVLHSFCASAHCADGAFPAAAVHLDGSGNLFGTTFGGGAKSAHCDDIGVGGCGTVFKLVPNGAASQETVLHRFCAKKNCADGGYPLAGVLVGADGELFGATLYGGGNGDAPGSGTVFTLDDTEQPLYRFCAKASCTDGAKPEGDLLQDPSGALFGTALFSGANGTGGTVFEITP